MQKMSSYINIAVTSISLTGLLFGCIGCAETCEEIEVSYLLRDSASRRSIDICEVINHALAKDESAIRQLSLMTIGGAAGYELGAVLVEVVEKVGERYYVESVIGVSRKDKRNIEELLRAGIEYGTFDQKYESLEMGLPIVWRFLQAR